MKVRTRWTYGYFKDDTFEEVVEVDDGLDEDAMKDAVMDAIWAEGNLPLHPVKSEYPGDPVEEFLSFTVVADGTPATIPSTEKAATNDEIIRIVFTVEDVKGIAAENDIDVDLALERAWEWAKYIADTASGLCSQQLESCILIGSP